MESDSLSFAEGENVAETLAAWTLRERFQLGAMLALLVLFGTLESVTYVLNGKVFMVSCWTQLLNLSNRKSETQIRLLTGVSWTKR